MVTKFQRTTAAVEGRNGYLTQVHHSPKTRAVSMFTTLGSRETISTRYIKDAIASLQVDCLEQRRDPWLEHKLQVTLVKFRLARGIHSPQGFQGDFLGGSDACRACDVHTFIGSSGSQRLEALSSLTIP